MWAFGQTCDAYVYAAYKLSVSILYIFRVATTSHAERECGVFLTEAALPVYVRWEALAASPDTEESLAQVAFSGPGIVIGLS